MSASRASSECVRRAWMRSSDATVCRLFFTRWWISRIVASLVMSSCSWWRSSVTSRLSTIAPIRSPRWRIGIARSDTVTPARLDVGAPRRAAGDDERQRLVDDELAAQQARW